MGALAEKVRQARNPGGEAGAMAASFGEPAELNFESESSRDQRIKEWGLYVGLAFATYVIENPFEVPEAAIEAAHEAAREVLFEENEDLQSAEAVSA